MAKMVFFQLVEFLLGDPNCKLETSPVPQRSAAAPPFLRPSSPILPPFERTPNTQNPPFPLQANATHLFLRIGRRLEGSEPHPPTNKKSVYTPSLWGHSPPAAANTPLKKRALHFKQKKHPTPSSPAMKTPLFLPLAIVFVAS